jgi:glutathionylspermidine synthase
MRYADYAYTHVQENQKDPARMQIIDDKAKQSGYESTVDYIHDVQGREDTRVFDGANNRTCWMNEQESLYGWNNKDNPSKSTVIPSSDTEKSFENHKEKEETRLEQELPERQGLTEEERTVEKDKDQTDSSGGLEWNDSSDKSHDYDR